MRDNQDSKEPQSQRGRDNQDSREALLSRCHVSKLERKALLKTINDMSGMLYESLPRDVVITRLLGVIEELSRLMHNEG